MINEVLRNWKLNILEVKWKKLKHNHHEFSEAFIDSKIETIQAFFHEKDLHIEEKDQLSRFSLTNPSNKWLVFLLSQKNIASYELIISICDVIEFFLVKNPNYLKSKLLQKNGRLNQKSFRQDFFEVWLNYRLIKLNIPVQLQQCYRNSENPDSEGFDSKFQLGKEDYIIECVKLQSWKEESLELVYQMIKNLFQWQEKLSRKSQPVFDPFTILAEPGEEMANGGVELRKHLDSFMKNDKRVFQSSSKGFSNVLIFKEDEPNKNLYHQKFYSKNFIELSSEFTGYELKDEKGNLTLNYKKGLSSENVNFKLTAKTKLKRSPSKYENHLIGKIKKKTRQHSKFSANTHLIIAIELEVFNGLTRFPIKSIEGFKKLRKLTKPNLSIIIFYKDSQGEQLKIKSQSIHFTGNKFFDLFNN